jgi:ribosome-associated toxin RatA of RatAB toxin-antitoxin module
MKNYILFLPLIYFGFGLCFHKNIHVISKTFHNLLSDISTDSFYNSSGFNCESISKGETFSDILISDFKSVKKEEKEEKEETINSFTKLNLPCLSVEDKIILSLGGTIQKQHRDGFKGSGLVVIDIFDSPDIIFEALTQIAMYQNMIPIVKSSKIISSDGLDLVAQFTLSKFLLPATVKHTILKDERVIKFLLDPTQINLLFKEAEGFWHVQIPKDRPEGYSRVYLSAQVLTDKIIPTFILDYAFTNALSKATNWLKPYFFLEK